MKLFNAVVLGLVIGTLQWRPSVSSARGTNRISDYFADHSHPGSVIGTTNDVAAGAADRLPPPVPARPALSPPGEPYLPLYASASDEVWDKAKCKGTNFVRAMRGSDKEAGSVFSPPRESAAGEFEDISMALRIASSTSVLTCSRRLGRMGLGYHGEWSRRRP